jgi:hypothetical protein
MQEIGRSIKLSTHLHLVLNFALLCRAPSLHIFMAGCFTFVFLFLKVHYRQKFINFLRFEWEDEICFQFARFDALTAVIKKNTPPGM